MVADLFEMNSGGGHYVTDTEENLTPIAPRDETIYELNNREQEFSSDGIEERSLNYLEKREENLLKSKESADPSELEVIQCKLNVVQLKLEDNKIQDRFEILDL